MSTRVALPPAWRTEGLEGAGNSGAQRAQRATARPAGTSPGPHPPRSTQWGGHAGSLQLCDGSGSSIKRASPGGGSSKQGRNSKEPSRSPWGWVHHPLRPVYSSPPTQPALHSAFSPSSLSVPIAASVAFFKANNSLRAMSQQLHGEPGPVHSRPARWSWPCVPGPAVTTCGPAGVSGRARRSLCYCPQRGDQLSPSLTKRQSQLRP